MKIQTIYKIELTESENQLFTSVLRFNTASYEQARNILHDCEELATILLSEKDRIPLSRLNYFFEPEYNISSPKSSRKEIFERNGTNGNSILSHGNFVKYLIYWVNGANVDKEIKNIAANTIVNDYYKDHDCITKFFNAIRSKIPRNHQNSEFSEEIFKLAIDSGMSLMYATLLRDKVRSVK
mgnify:CR=1 FL=1